MADFILKKYPSLGDKNYLKFAVSQFVSLSGGYIQNVALSALIREQTEVKFALGIFLFASYMPVFLLSFPASKLASVIKIKTLLIVTEILLFCLSILLVIWVNMPFWGFVIYGAVWGTVRAFQTPAASSVAKIICDKSIVPSAVSVSNLALSLSKGAGPLLSGFVYSLRGFRAAFIVNALTFIPSLLLIFKTDIPSKKQNTSKQKPNLNIFLLVSVFVLSFFGTSYNVIFSSFCKSLNLSKLWFSLMMGFVGIGAAIGSFVFANKKQKAYFGYGISLCLMVLSFVTNKFVALFVALLWGFSDYLFFTFALNKINKDNSKESISSAMGIYTAVTTGALPLGYLVLNFMTEGLGIVSTLILSSLATAFCMQLFFGKIR